MRLKQLWGISGIYTLIQRPNNRLHVLWCTCCYCSSKVCETRSL